MTSFAQKVAMWVGAIVIAIALGGFAFWVVSNVGRSPIEAENTQPVTPSTQQPPPVQPASTQPVDIQVTGTVVRTNPAKLEITIREVVLEPPPNITLCRTENILVRLRQNDPAPSENDQVRIKGAYNHQECNITLKGAGHSIAIIPAPTLPISLTATINEMNDARNVVKVKVTEVQWGHEPCTRENLTVRLKDPLPLTVSLQDKAEIKGNYHPAICEVRLNTPDTSITFPPVLIELHGTVRSVRSNIYALGDWRLVPDRSKLCQDPKQDLTVEVVPGRNADREVPRNQKVIVRGEYYPLLCVVKVLGDNSQHLFRVEQPSDWLMTAEGVVLSFTAGEKMELGNLKIDAEYPPCDTSKLTIDLTDKTWANKSYPVGTKVTVKGRYYKDECSLKPETVDPGSKVSIFPGFLSAGLIVSHQAILYSAGLGLAVYDRFFVQGTFATGSGIAKTKTGVTMSLNVTAFALSASYKVLDEFYLSTGAGALLVRQSLGVWSSTVFVPIVRICLGYRLGIFMMEGGFYVSLGPVQ